MKISYQWLKEYLPELPSPEKTAQILTNIGLEVESMEKHESIPGGLAGFVIGEVIRCEKHPNADTLSKTIVNIGNDTHLDIVCGAPNVAAGQKVVVATVGTTIYLKDDSFRIKKSKIRGEVSEGMICAEDELGLGNNHDGILVLSDDPQPGLPARDYFRIDSDYLFEIGLTPNRIDAASHYGVARDLAAFLGQDHKIELHQPSVESFKVDNHDRVIEVDVQKPEACVRYSSLSISGVKVTESPEWLKKKLQSIGQKPINAVVDVTNFVLHEIGQPLHAFDADQIVGNKVVVKSLADKTPFVCLDDSVKELSSDDLMICNEAGGMCIAGVFGGKNSGVTFETQNVFLESACFDSVFVRKTARRHGLNTDASFRFERGSDPEITLWALKRAALLIQEIAGGTISSPIDDWYPNPVPRAEVNLSYAHLDRLVGNSIERDLVKQILKGLEIQILSESNDALNVSVPAYRVDVKRESDVIEEILRIYGYNYVQIARQVRSTLNHWPNPNPYQFKEKIADWLAANDYNEMMCNSLSKAAYYDSLQELKPENLVRILNPLSQDLNVLRQDLLFGGLETIAYNANRKNPVLQLFEFGNTYRYDASVQADNPLRKYKEEEHLGLFITGAEASGNWLNKEFRSDFYHLKTTVDLLLKRMGVSAARLESKELNDELFLYGLSFSIQGKTLVDLGAVHPALLQRFDLQDPVYYARFHWNEVFRIAKQHQIQFSDLPKFPMVRRDLAMILDQSVTFDSLVNIAQKLEKKLLRKVTIFDVYQGKNIPEGKKSYALSFYLQDDSKTLNDKYIDKVMNQFMSAFEKELGAQIRS